MWCADTVRMVDSRICDLLRLRAAGDRWVTAATLGKRPTVGRVGWNVAHLERLLRDARDAEPALVKSRRYGGAEQWQITRAGYKRCLPGIGGGINWPA